jgi:hypothetical protein
MAEKLKIKRIFQPRITRILIELHPVFHTALAAKSRSRKPEFYP